MRRFEIVDGIQKDARPCALLEYDTGSREFFITIYEGVSENDLPMTLAACAARGIYHIDAKLSRRWVDERIVPSGRQNLGEVLRAHGLDEYDPFELLVQHDGRCAQDDFFIREITEKPEVPAPSPAQAVGEKLAQARKRRNMTQKALSERSGIPQPSISAIENGAANPTIETLGTLAKGLELYLYVAFEEQRGE